MSDMTPDRSSVTSIDYSGLQAMIMVMHDGNPNGAPLTVAESFAPQIQRLIEITGLSEIRRSTAADRTHPRQLVVRT